MLPTAGSIPSVVYAAEPVVLRARWLFPVAAPPLEGGWVEVRAGRVVGLGVGAPPSPAIDLGDVALLPGLVNPHVHLEFSALAAPLKPAGTESAHGSEAPPQLGSRGVFPKWIEAVVSWRRGLPPDFSTAEAVGAGLAETHARGAAFLGEIASCDWRPEDPAFPLGRSDRRSERPELLVFREAIALGPERAAAALAAAQAHLEAAAKPGSGFRGGLSPHAPYTVRFELVEALAQLAGRCGATTAMHLAESPDELELLQTGGGPFRTLLETLGAWRDDAFARPRRILDYLHALRPAPRVLVVHGNFLVEEEVRLLAEEHARCTLVHCPRTHAAFGWPRLSIGALQAAGVRIALGTDGRSSNPDLDLWAEMRFAAARNPDVAPPAWLEMVTRTPAASLGAEDFGVVARGARARFAVAEPPGASFADPYDALLAAPAVRPLWFEDGAA